MSAYYFRSDEHKSQKRANFRRWEKNYKLDSQIFGPLHGFHLTGASVFFLHYDSIHSEKVRIQRLMHVRLLLSSGLLRLLACFWQKKPKKHPSCFAHVAIEIFLFLLLSLSLIDSIVSLCLSSLSERLHSSPHRGSLRQHQRSDAAAEPRGGRGLQGEGRRSPSKMAHTRKNPALTRVMLQLLLSLCCRTLTHVVCVLNDPTDSRNVSLFVDDNNVIDIKMKLVTVCIVLAIWQKQQRNTDI